jgi:DNA-binding response OmpR family regulator
MKILLVEDEKEICRLYQDILSTSGFEVVVCQDGETGVENAKKGDWDILLLDIMLPGKDGLEILGEINGLGLTKQKKVVILTNIEKQEVLEQASVLGATKYIIKSEINPSQLIEIVTSL